MDLFSQIDIYCERLAPGLLAEPLNLFSNGSFLVAAYFCSRYQRTLTETPMPAAVKWLTGWLFLVGIGSIIFHSFANLLSQFLDVGPIGVFVISFLYLWNRQVLQRSILRILGDLVILIALTALFLTVVPKDAVGGSQGYFSVVIFLGYYGFLHHKLHREKGLIKATGLFVLALIFRSLDELLCPIFPHGLHFLWHLCVGGVGFICLHEFIKARSAVATGSNLYYNG